MHEIALQLLKERNMKYSNGLYRYTQIELAYNSNHIEGNSLSKAHTESLFSTNSILTDGEKIIRADDIVEMNNHFRAFDFILNNYDNPLSEEIIKETHAILLKGTKASEENWFKTGEYKTVENTIGGEGINTTHPADVPAAMSDLLQKYNPGKIKDINDIIAFHADFEKIHPFQDGNGRVGRLVMFKECLRYNITPFIIDASHRLFYYRGLKEYPTVKGYLVDTCLSAQDRYKMIYDRFCFKSETEKDKEEMEK